MSNLLCSECEDFRHHSNQCNDCHDPVLATYNRDESNASLEEMEYVLYMGAEEILCILRKFNHANTALDRMYNEVNLILDYSLYNFYDNT